MERNRGSTLLEVMVVMGIIVLLLSLLLPGLKSGKQHGQAVICASRLKQIALSSIIYSQDYQAFTPGFYESLMSPPPGGYVGDASKDDLGWWWFHYLSIWDENLRDHKNTFWCPSRPRLNSHDENILCSNYAVNYAISKIASHIESEFEGKPIPIAQIKQPCSTLMYTDSGYALIGWKAALSSRPVPFENSDRKGSFFIPGLEFNQNRLTIGPDKIEPDQEFDAVYGRHPGPAVNIAFIDGHVRKEKVLRLETEPDSIPLKPSYIWLSK